VNGKELVVEVDDEVAGGVGGLPIASAPPSRSD
jgi:hypothetical protein